MASTTLGFIASLRNAGIAAHDNDQVRLNKTLLVFATGLVSAASMMWLPLYWDAGAERSALLMLLFQGALASNLLLYLRSQDFHSFRLRQLALFLLFPFVAHWGLADFSAGSGLILWGLLGPIAAILCFGVAESVKWFIAYVALIALTALIDGIGPAQLPPEAALINRHSAKYLVLNCAAISSIVYLMLRYAMGQKQKLEGMLLDAHKLLQIEQARSQRLLRNVLPDAIAERLKSSDEPIADGFADVSVLFADLVNFTPVAARLSPVEVFALLNRIFSRFDDLVEQHGLEKIKTIGDAYMVAGGLNPGDRNFTAAMANLALAMQRALADFRVGGQVLEVRIGIATGPVVAGVVGKKKFTYDLWGDTVNLASRLSEEAAPGAILIDTPSAKRLHARHLTRDTGSVQIKGLGAVSVFELQPPVPLRRNTNTEMQNPSSR